MKKFWCFITVMLAGLCSEAKAGFVNGGFETGNLSGWSIGGAGTVSVVNSHTTSTSGPFATYNPVEGNYFAVLAGENVGVYTTIQQSFSVAVGDTLFGSAFFDADDYLPYNDDAYVRILQGNNVLFYSDVSQVGDYGNTPWTNFTYTFSAGGTYTLEAGVRNVLDGSLPSVLGIDGFVAGPTAVPEPGSILVWGMSIVGAVAAKRRRSRRVA